MQSSMESEEIPLSVTSHAANRHAKELSGRRLVFAGGQKCRKHFRSKAGKYSNGIYPILKNLLFAAHI